MKFGLVSFAAALLSANPADAYGDYGLVNLDNATMPLLCGKQLPCFVRFDKEFPHGDDAEQFKIVARAAAHGGADIIMGSVGISEYGERKNMDLGVKFGLIIKDKPMTYDEMDAFFPKFFLLPAGLETNIANSILYKEPIKVDNMLRFIREHAGVAIGLKGTVAQLDLLAERYMHLSASSAELNAHLVQLQEVSEQAEKIIPTLSETQQDAASYYLKVMERISEKGSGWVQKEIERLDRIISKGNIPSDTSEAMSKRLNVLASFKGLPGSKTEL